MIRPTNKFLTLIPMVLITFTAFGMKKDTLSAQEEKRLTCSTKCEKCIAAEKILLSRKNNTTISKINYHLPPRTSGRHIYYETDSLMQRNMDEHYGTLKTGIKSSC